MERIRCPHCGAVNQDVTPEDNCWQCGKPLSASAATAEAEGSAEAGTPVQQLRQKPARPTLEERVAARKAERAAARRTNMTPVIVVLIILIILLVIFLLMRH